MSDLIERLKAENRKVSLACEYSYERGESYVAEARLRDVLTEAIAALSVAPAPVAANPFADEFSEEALNEIAESAQKLSFALGRGEIDGDDSATYLICRFLDEIAECVTDAGIKWNDEDGSLHIPAPPVQEGAKGVEPIPRAVDFFNPLTLAEAKALKVCRICRVNDNPYPNNPFVYHFGTEYAHQKCIDASSPERLDSSPAQSIPAAIDEEKQQ